MANNPSNLIQFKRGSMAQLETLMNNKTGIDGTFYLTVDDDTSGSNNPSKSSRLFVGRADGSIVPVNQGIITVQNIGDLTENITGKWHAGDYAYVLSDNILAIYDGHVWKQINSIGSDTYVTDFTQNVEATSNTATINTQVSQNNNQTAKQSAVKIAGTNGVTVTADNTTKTITVAGDPYTLSSNAPTSNATTIHLKHGASGTTDAGTISVSSASDGKNIRITNSDANNIQLEAPVVNAVDINSYDATHTAQINGNTVNSGFIVQVGDSHGNTAAEAFDPTITYGEDGDQVVHFLNGNATLNVYTKAEIDEKELALNGLTYRGTVGTEGAKSSISAYGDLHNGDMFMVAGSAYEYASGSTAQPGDLIIVKGAEDINGVVRTPSYDVVPSGNDTDTYYVGNTNTHQWGINVASGGRTNAENLGSIKLTEGTAITLTDTEAANAGPNKQIQVSHANVNNQTISYTGADVTKDIQGGTEQQTFTAIAGITVNQQGHVTNVTTNTLTLPKEIYATDVNGIRDVLTADTVVDSQNNTRNTHTGTGAKNSVSVTTGIQLTRNNGVNTTEQTAKFSMSSDNLTITANTTNQDVKMNFVWGTF